MNPINFFKENVMEMEFTATDVDGEEVVVLVEYKYYAGCRGAREDGTGLQLEPDSPAEIEILSVKDENDEDYELTEDEAQEVIEKAEEEYLEACEDAKAEAQIAAYEARMDY